ncbi:hypothetical protein C8J57DRAFT_1439834 [Mycena rebaudengoi]|nr:hypothetical protein C8J57DRAFT_1439834 [Mycena rebaudengoi]
MDRDDNEHQWIVPYTPSRSATPGTNSFSTFTAASYGSTGALFTNTTPATPTFGFNVPDTPFSFLDFQSPQVPQVPLATPNTSSKRRRRNSNIQFLPPLDDENIPPTPSKSEKLETILDTIKAQGWTLADFLFRVFRVKDSVGNPISRTQKHAQMASAFLSGRTTHTPADILTFWMTSPDGIVPDNSPQLNDMYSTKTPYSTIRPVRPALTSFALQTVGVHLARGAERAVHASSGLHASVKSKDVTKKLKWARIGSETISVVGDIIEYHLEAAWYLLDLIAMRKRRKRNGVEEPARKHRPARGVIIHALADLLFCRSDNANLLPLARGILYFGSSAPVEIMAYNCRIGTMPAYSTISRSLLGLSIDEAEITLAHGSDPEQAGALYFDNIQSMARVRDHRIGRANHMNCIKVMRRRIENSERMSLTVDKLLSFLDQEDSDTTGYLQWLEVLVRCIESLNPLIPEVNARYRATAKLVIPLEKSKIHPLATSGKKETIPAELKEGLLDFLAQIGQTSTSYIRRKLIVGGDGLSYAMLLQLQAYLQFHKDAFKSFEFLEPQLQVWHTKWTDIIRIFQTHWGRILGKSTNPASLGHSAGKIGRAAPANMKKVEFYPGSQLLYLVLDARMLDCWSLQFGTDDIFGYFKNLATSKKIPDLEDLVAMAKKLNRTYSTARARDHAMFDTGTTSDWSKTIPKGSPWVPIEIEKSSLDKTTKRKSKAKKKGKEKEPLLPCKGDFVLAQAIDFLRDALNSRKITRAVAEGDVGRMYSCIKYMLFTFAGSTHTNYMGYILETIINLELESSPGLKEALLMCLLINLSGLAGHFEEGDYVVEFFNRLIEDVVQHKNAQFDDNFIRNVISRNLRHIAELKVAWRTGTGMQAKSGTHTDMHTKPEFLELLKSCRETELHSQRLGRQIDDRDTNDFGAGIKKLRNGAIEKHNKKHERMHRTKRPPTSAPAPPPSTETDDEAEESSDNESSELEGSDSDEDMEPGARYATRGSMAMVNGELVMDDRDMMVGPDGDMMMGEDAGEEVDDSASEDSDDQ